MGLSQKEEKLAVDCGYWHLYRYNPTLEEQGKNPFSLDSKAPTEDYKDFIMGEVRYSSLKRSFPDKADKLYDQSAADAEARFEHLSRLTALYEPKADAE